eukprot:COSAG02_NODE_64782_length_259_cov_1.256250_1_plen_52_part_01
MYAVWTLRAVRRAAAGGPARARISRDVSLKAQAASVGNRWRWRESNTEHGLC